MYFISIHSSVAAYFNSFYSEQHKVGRVASGHFYAGTASARMRAECNLFSAVSRLCDKNLAIVSISESDEMRHSSTRNCIQQV